jgi:putative DNA-invertase from lambdoid prophage Rac
MIFQMGRLLQSIYRTLNNVMKHLAVLTAMWSLGPLGGVDLTSPAGKMTMQVIAAVAEFERDLLIERTHSGINRAKAAGKRFGRRPSLNTVQQAAVLQSLDAGASIAEVAREFKTTRQTIMRVREAGRKLSSPKED